MISAKTNYIVTGAAGVLGSAVTTNLAHSGTTVVGLGRRSKPDGILGGWAQCDLLDLISVRKSLPENSVVIHCASSVSQPQNDRLSLRNLIAVAEEHRCHIVYVSICSMETAEVYNAYYKVKLADEKELASSAIPHTIVRISQFHPFVSHLLSRLVVGSFILAPKLRFQPIDVDFAAQQLCEFAKARFEGRTPDVHGPQELGQSELIKTWLEARCTSKIVLPIPRFGKLKQLGRIEPVKGIAGGRTWSQWLSEDGNSPTPYTW